MISLDLGLHMPPLILYKRSRGKRAPGLTAQVAGQRSLTSPGSGRSACFAESFGTVRHLNISDEVYGLGPAPIVGQPFRKTYRSGLKQWKSRAGRGFLTEQL